MDKRLNIICAPLAFKTLSPPFQSLHSATATLTSLMLIPVPVILLFWCFCLRTQLSSSCNTLHPYVHVVHSFSSNLCSHITFAIRLPLIIRQQCSLPLCLQYTRSPLLYSFYSNHLLMSSIRIKTLSLSLIFLMRPLVFPILLFSSISLHCSLKKAFLPLLAILWNSFIRWVLSFLLSFVFHVSSFLSYL